MPELLTRLDFYEIGRQYVLTRAKRIEPTVVDIEGSDANLFVGSQSFCADAVKKQVVDCVSALLLDGAEKDDLDRYAWDRYGMTRKGAAAATVPVVFTRPTAAVGGGSLTVGTKIASKTGIEYVLTSAATFSATSLRQPATARAVQAGKEFQVGRHTLVQFQNQSSIFDQTILVDNEDPAAGGEPVESDDTFRNRIRDFWPSARRGTLGAIEFGARTVPGVDSAVANDILEPTGYPGRAVELFISDSSGVANSTLVALVDAALFEFRAGGIYVVIRTSVPQIVDVSLRLAFTANVDTVTLAGDIRGAVVGYINGLGVGKPLLRDEIAAVLARFRDSGLLMKSSTIVTPAGDLYPDIGYTLRVRPENVSVI